MKSIFRIGLVSVCFGLGTLAYPQEPGGRQSEQREQRETQEVSYTGCLTKASAGQYMIVDQRTGEKLIFGASEKVEQYVNQTVTLTGRILDRNGERLFQPESIKVISTSCEALPK